MWENKRGTFHGWLITIRVPLTDLKDPWDMSENHCSNVFFLDMVEKAKTLIYGWQKQIFDKVTHRRATVTCASPLRCKSVKRPPRLLEAVARKTKRKSLRGRGLQEVGDGLSISVWVLLLSEKFPYYVPRDVFQDSCRQFSFPNSDSHYDESYRINFYQCYR